MKERKQVVIKQLLTSRATSTVKRYTFEIRKFLCWCQRFGVEVQLPFDSATIAIYLSQCFQHSNSSASLALVYSAVKWLHTFVPVSNPLDNNFCRNILESAKRVSGKPVSKKTPISADIIKLIIDNFAGPQSSLKHLRIATICTLGFAGFLRYNELCNILPSHLNFYDTYMTIFIPRSKTDVYREGNIVYINGVGNKYCPVNLVKKYMKAASISFDSNLPLFRPLIYYKKSNSYSLRSSKLSYSRCREVFKSCLEELGLDPKCYGLHSLRSGGITSVVHHSGNSISDRLLKLHGRWKTDAAKDMYVHEDVHKRLEITKYLGL